MKVAFALAVHSPDDEMTCEHLAKSLNRAGCDILIVSAIKKDVIVPYNDYSISFFDGSVLSKKQMMNRFYLELSQKQPDVVICDNPIAVLAAHRYRKSSEKPVKILYYITEWYPSKKNLRQHSSLIIRIFKTIILSFVSFITPFFLSGFIFGEYYKSLPFKILFPLKKYIFLPYYTDAQYIVPLPAKDISQKCTLLYGGPATTEKGFYTFVETVKKCAAKFPNTKFVLRLICEPEIEMKITEKNIIVQYSKYLVFHDFCKEISKADICFDLRKIDVENTRCFPVKIFFYMAAGRPVVYSDLKAIRKELPEIDEFGFLVNPEKTDNIVEKISQYIENQNLYQQHCSRARALAETKYNWRNIEKEFVEFISK